MLRVDIAKQLGEFSLQASFASAGRVTGLFGASGAGKTSLINIIAGLLRPDRGIIAIDGETLDDTEAGLHIAAHRRRIGYVFQDARLFPHLNVRQNLRFGRWFTPKTLRYADEEPIVAMLGIGPLLERKPHQLSGGERQRVALGRALLQSPRLLLMDEPLASLDEPRKREVMPYIERLRDEMKVPIIYVSHSADEVARLATGIAVMAKGKVARAGPAQEILPFLGALAGDSSHESGALLEMKVVAYDAESDLTLLLSGAGEARVPGRVAREGAKVRLHIKARDVMIATARPQGLSALNVFPGRVSAMSPAGLASIDVMLTCGDAEIGARITRHSAHALALKPGQEAFAVVKTMSVDAPYAAPAAPDVIRAASRSTA